VLIDLCLFQLLYVLRCPNDVLAVRGKFPSVGKLRFLFLVCEEGMYPRGNSYANSQLDILIILREVSG
jgi:hypothetical protein